MHSTQSTILGVHVSFLKNTYFAKLLAIYLKQEYDRYYGNMFHSYKYMQADLYLL